LRGIRRDVLDLAPQLHERLFYIASKVPPHEGTRPTTPCRPGPLTRRPGALTRRHGFLSSCIARPASAAKTEWPAIGSHAAVP
jgi:hypothetical protein